VPVATAYERLRAELTGAVKRDELMARHTTFRIGGPSALFVECANLADLARAIEVCEGEGLEWTVLGKGSNVLASDEGYDGAVIVLGRDFKRHSVVDGHVRSGSGVTLAVLVQEAFNIGLTGFEFAVGIPGTLGGALAMNAGFKHWACTDDLMKMTRDGRALYMHCLPADVTGVSCEAGEVSAPVFERCRLDTYRQAGHKPFVIAAMILATRFREPAEALRLCLDAARPRRLA